MTVRSFNVSIPFLLMMLFFGACKEVETPPLFYSSQLAMEMVNNAAAQQFEPPPVVLNNFGGSPQVGGEAGTPTDSILITVGQQSEGAIPGISLGSTVQHKVQAGEWLMQIARCYGADYRVVRQANPAIIYPNFIVPGLTVTVPNVGSVGEARGAPCVAEYVVIEGDTWIGLAERFGTTAVILQRVNPGPLLVGAKVIVPAHPTATAVNQLIIVTPYVAPEPSRILFTAGETAASINGTVAASRATSYVFGAREEQVYKITLTSSSGDVTFSLINPANAGQALPAEGILPTSGDYIIQVIGGAVDATFTLTLTIITP